VGADDHTLGQHTANLNDSLAHPAQPADGRRLVSKRRA
jgi:hypothetical protein